MIKLKQREKIILIFTVALITVYVVVYGVIKPLRNNGQDMTNQIRVTQERLRKSMHMIEKVKTLDNDYQKLVEVFGKASSEAAEASAMVARLESVARETNIHITNMQPQRAVNQGALTAFPVDLSIDGSWPDITKFLYEVQAAPDLFNIDEMNLEKYSDTASSLRGHIVLSRLRIASSN